MRLTTHQRPLSERLCRPAALLCVLILPAALLYARALAEILIGVTDALFLIHLWLKRDLLFWRRPFAGRAFALAAVAWWLWQIVCSALGTGGVVLSLVLFRLPLFAVALGSWVLIGTRARRAVWMTVAVSVSWIILQCWQQYVFGRNIFGAGRWEDGALTGPFTRPRAGPELILTLFAVLVPSAAHLLAAPGRVRRAGGVVLVAVAAASVLLIGQRMPSALLLLGLVLSALLLPRLRLAVAAAVAAGSLVLAATPLLAPATYGKLVIQTRDQLGHFAHSAYGQIWMRATMMAAQHPWTGLGFDSFRRGCAGAQARGAGDACNIHPHNYYLEAADNGGVPLLLLFTTMVVCAGTALARGRLTAPRAGLLVGFILAFWPLASTSAFTSMPNAGWIFLLLGLGLSAREA
jgi:O-antigen ligase